MKLTLSSKNMKLSEALREHIEHRLYFALSRFSPKIARVSVRVEDINGPRGGVDKQCKIVVKLDRLGELSVEATDAEVYAAVDSAADRVGRTVRRELERRRTMRRYGSSSDRSRTEQIDRRTQSD
jgi:ribosomal subunit interface protein